jgi:hypothetical protein
MLIDSILPNEDAELIVDGISMTGALWSIRAAFGVPLPGIDEVHFKDPCTKIIWHDGSSTKVVCKDETYDREKGFAMAVLKKAFGSSYYRYMSEWTQGGQKTE